MTGDELIAQATAYSRGDRSWDEFVAVIGKAAAALDAARGRVVPDGWDLEGRLVYSDKHGSPPASPVLVGEVWRPRHHTDARWSWHLCGVEHRNYADWRKAVQCAEKERRAVAAAEAAEGGETE